MHNPLKKIDTKEFELPETVFVSDIENRVFQSIVFETIARIDGVSTVEGNIIDALLGREHSERLKGIHVDQDEKSRAVRIKVDVNVAYGVSVPEKAEEIQTRVSTEVSALTGVHVSSVHVVFKNLIHSQPEKAGAACEKS